MAITITITDGTETATLTATDALLESYEEKTPDVDAGSVTETLEVSLIGGNTAVDATIAKLERLFQGSRERVGGAYGIAYTYIKVTIDSAVWRSPVLDGKVVIAGDAWLKYERATGLRKASVIVTREAWWEADSEVQIPLTNSNGTNDTAGLKVYNCRDLTGSSPNQRDNLVQVNGAAHVLGDLPAPVRMEVTVGVTYTMTDLMIAQNVYSTPGSLTTWYEYEAVSGGWGHHDDALASGGGYHSVVSTTPVVDLSLGSEVGYLKAGYYRILGRISALGTWKFRPYYYDGSGIKHQNTITVIRASANFYWQDMGIIQAPVRYFPGAVYTSGHVGWEAFIDVAGTLGVDCIQFTPLDGWKRAKMMGVVGNGKLIIDEILGNIWSEDYLGNVNGSASVTGDILKVYPNKLQRFYFVWNTTDTDAVVDASVGVKMWYRPRKRTL